jgi:hypothetical protein
LAKAMFWVVGSSRLQKRAQFGLHRPTISGRPTLKADARVRTVRPHDSSTEYRG